MLRGSSLRYYEKKPEFANRKSATKPKGELIIDAHAVAEAHKAEDSPWESFQVTTTANGSKNLAVFAESRTEKEHWLRILQAVIRGDDPTPFVDAPIVLDDDASGSNNGSAQRIEGPAERHLCGDSLLPQFAETHSCRDALLPRRTLAERHLCRDPC